MHGNSTSSAHDVLLVLLGQHDQRLHRTGPIGISDDEEELPVVLGHGRGTELGVPRKPYEA